MDSCGLSMVARHLAKAKTVKVEFQTGLAWHSRLGAFGERLLYVLPKNQLKPGHS